MAPLGRADSPVHKTTAAVLPAATIAPAAAVTTVAPGVTAVAPLVAALAVFPLAGSTAVFELVATAIAPLALGDKVTVELWAVKQRAPCTFTNSIDTALEAVREPAVAVVQLIRSAVRGAGLSGLAEDCAGGKQGLKGE